MAETAKLAPSPWASLGMLRSRAHDFDEQQRGQGMQGLLDALALSTMPVPVVGDVAGLASDAYRFATDPESRTWGNAAWASLGALPFVPYMGAIRAYHGSPHTFDKFDMGKLGTGEGAQAYGHGLYFAENADVAKEYQKKLSLASDNQGAVTQYRGKPIVSFRELSKQPLEQVDPDQFLIHAAQAFGGVGKTAAERVKRSEQILNSWFPNASPEYRSQLAARAKEVKPDDFLTTNGTMYTVNLDVEPEDLLDWDAPLSQQSEKVRKAMESAGIGPRQVRFNQPGPDLWYARDEATGDLVGKIQQHRRGFTVEAFGNDKGGEFPTLEEAQAALSGNSSGVGVYNTLAKQAGGDAAASRALREAGIPGLKYWDGGSRASGEGTRNFVLFDDTLAKILERNGQPLP